MKQFLNLLSSIRLGFYLLIVASFVLFAGAVTAEFFMNDYYDLNFMRFPVWLTQHADQPLLYSWILVLFAVLFLLALNTFACVITYFRSVFEHRQSLRRISILLFHVCFLVFLAGHCLYEFTGNSTTLVLEQNISQNLPDANLSASTSSIEKETIDSNGTPITLKKSAVLAVRYGDEKVLTIRPESMRPAYAHGYTFHVAMNDKGIAHNQIRIIARKEYGLYFLATGGFLALFAGILYSLFAFRNRSDHLDRIRA